MSDEVKSEIVFHSPADIPVTADNARFVGARRPGRPKGPTNLLDAINQELAKDQNASKVARNLIRIAKSEKRENAAVGSAKELLDRTVGKPVQPIAVASMDDNTVNRLLKIAEMFVGPNK